jgi:C4-dicarboxylate transporter DctM subunit
MFGARKAQRQPFNLKKGIATIGDGVWALLLPFFILGGIYSGLFNATQAAAMSVVLAIVIEVYIHRSMLLRDLPKLIADNALLLGALLLIIMLATGFSSYAEDNRLPEMLGELLGTDMSPLLFLLLLNLMLLLAGTVLDIISAIVLFVPLVVPLAKELGFDPLHIGIIFIVNLEIGYLTPPIGLNLFVATSYFKQPFGLVVRSVAPFLMVMIVSLGVITYVPTITVGLPNLARGDDVWEGIPDKKIPGAIVEDAAPTGDESMQDLMDSDPDVKALLEELNKRDKPDDTQPAPPAPDDPDMDEYDEDPPPAPAPPDPDLDEYDKPTNAPDAGAAPAGDAATPPAGGAPARTPGD